MIRYETYIFYNLIPPTGNFIMLMKVMYVPMVMYLTDGSSKMRMYIFHPRKLQDLISLE